MSRTCFVSDEFFPVKPGGIGRVLFNLLHERSASEPAYVLLVGASDDEIAALDSLFGDRIVFRAFHFSDDDATTFDAEGRKVVSRAGVSGTTQPIARSNAILFALLRWQHDLETEFDIIEFPDFRGWGFGAINAKRTGLFFADTCLTVRLHSTASLIDPYEPLYLVEDHRHEVLREIERLAIRDADYVIAHLSGVRDLTRQHFRLPETWLDTCILQPSPVVALREGRANPSPTKRRALVFSSRLVPFKNVELFIRACSQYFQENPKTELHAVVACDGWDRAYIESIKALVPEGLRKKFDFSAKLDPEDRADLIGGSIFIMTSVIESFCLAAYEASLAGAVVILNGDCVAFDESSPWVDGVNCIKYRGGTRACVEAIARAQAVERIEVVPCPRPTPYFDDARYRPDRDRSAQGGASTPTVSAILHVDNNMEHLLPTLQALSKLRGVQLELVVVDDACVSPDVGGLLDAYGASFRLGPIKHVRLAVHHGRLRAFAEGWREATGDVVFFLEGGVIPDSQAFAGYIRALAEGRADAILPTVATFRSLLDHRARLYDRIVPSIGGGWNLLNHTVLSGVFPPLVRRASFPRFPFASSVAGAEFVDFVKVAGEGRRLVGSSLIGAFLWNEASLRLPGEVVEDCRVALDRLVRLHAIRDGTAAFALAHEVVNQVAAAGAWRDRTRTTAGAVRSPLKFVELVVSVGEPTSTRSGGREVWLFDVRLAQESLPPDSCTMHGDWVVKDDALVSGEIGATLVWALEVASDSDDVLSLRFLSHAWSGLTKIRVGRVLLEFDLYDANGLDRIIDIPVRDI